MMHLIFEMDKGIGLFREVVLIPSDIGYNLKMNVGCLGTLSVSGKKFCGWYSVLYCMFSLLYGGYETVTHIVQNTFIQYSSMMLVLVVP